jgi:Fe-S oxidoreductase
VENGMMLPEHMMMVDAMKQEDNVFGEPKSARGDWAKGLGLKDINKEKADVLFHAGCRFAYDEGLRGVVRGAVRILKDAGVDLGIAGADEACCGGRAFEVGYRGELEKYAEDFASRVKASGCSKLVTPCSDCYGAFKQLYPQVGKELGVEVLHVVEYVERLMGQGRIRPTVKVPLKVTYHDPCHLGRRGEPYREWKGEDKLKRPSEFKMTGTGGVYDAPRDIIRRLPGVELVEMERIREYSWCCGAGGGVMEAYPEFNSWSANERVDEALATGARAIVTACPWCERSFIDALEERDEDLEVLDLMELLARSLGGEPDA